MYTLRVLCSTLAQYNSLYKSSYIPDDGPVCPKHDVKFAWKHELTGDLTDSM
jgi:hypothetical protein